MRMLHLIVLFLLALTACSAKEQQQETVNWQASAAFTSDGVVMRGTESRIGVMDSRFKAEQTQNFIWFFWGAADEVTGKLTVFGTHRETGQKITVVPSTFIIPAKPLHGADNHFSAFSALPEPGLWKLDAYIDDGLFGTVFIEVQKPH